jgi:mannan endo-1,4-beta-mannosidase
MNKREKTSKCNKGMNFKPKSALLLILLLLSMCASSSLKANKTYEPVIPNASPEAKALLDFLYSISGRYTLTGQHNYPNIKDRNTHFAAEYTGRTPAVFSTDWGFARDGDTDSYLARPGIVKECIRQHQLGSIITICWHAVPPTAEEPITFRPIPDAKPESLASVQGQLLDQQFKDVLTPGTELYNRWCAQVDTIASYLKKLQDAHVPILWRPYHEMNGDWFWWGGRRGEYSTKKLYLQLFDRLVNYHKLNNLIWVWSVDRPLRPGMEFQQYYPGNEYLDVLALDVYRSDFNQSYYDGLVDLSKGKPVILAEVGSPPCLEIIEKQPKWELYVIWAGMVRNTLKKQYNILLNDPRILSLEDSAYVEVINPFRTTCGLPVLEIKEKQPPDFSGEWVLNEEKSVLDNFGANSIPYKLNIFQKGNQITIKETKILEYADDEITEEKMTLDGKEYESEFWHSTHVKTATRSKEGKTMIFESKVTFNIGDQKSEMITKEVWTLMEYGEVLSIEQSSVSFWGERNIKMIFDRN